MDFPFYWYQWKDGWKEKFPYQDCLRWSLWLEINEPVRETYYKGNERIDEVTPKYALLTTHAGRRTFICNALALGIPAQVVMKWTGHSDYKAMKPYIDIADDIKANAMNKFNQL